MQETNQTSQTQQPLNPTPTPVSNPTKSKLILIILGVAAIAIIAIGAYLLGTKQTETPVLYSTQTTPTPSPNPTVDETANWKTESAQIKKESSVSGSENINLYFQLPFNWTLKTVAKASNPNDIIKNCADYILTSNDRMAKLTISPICAGWGATYSNWPQSAVSIKEEKNVGNDGHIVYTVRYLDLATNQYKYVEGEKGTSNKIMDAILIRYNPSAANFLPANITLNYSGSDKDSVLEITDKIVASLKANN